MKHVLSLFLTIVVFHSLAQVKPVVATLPAATYTPPALPVQYTAPFPSNYNRTWQAIRPFTAEADLLSASRTAAEVTESSMYLDGMGRVLQVVARKASPGGKDVITPVLYDNSSRESFQYKPYAAQSSGGSFTTTPFSEQAAFMGAMYPGEQFYFSRTQYEASPLGRVAKELSPGNSWVGSAKGVSWSYEINAAGEVRKWSIGFNTGDVPVSSGFYNAGELSRTVTTDEHGKKVIEYKDMEERLVLKKIEIAHSGAAVVTSHIGWLCTYYVYDNLNNLRFVVQPRGTELLLAAGWVFDASGWSSSDIAREFCFIYEYDARGRLIVKRVPGANEVFMVYDVKDRLVLSQDGNMRVSGQWLVTQYDVLDRPVRKYSWINSTSRNDHRTAAWNSDNYPNLSGGNTTLLTATYYDNYAWVSGTGAAITGNFASAETSSGFITPSDATAPYARPVTASAQVNGLVTGTQSRILGSNSFLVSVNFYDDKGRVIQVKSTNITGATDIVTNQYSFNGKLLVVKMNHNASGFTPGNVTTITRNSYDDGGRLQQVSKQVNGGSIVILARNSYDEAGQLITKALGQQRTGSVYSTTPIETINCNYNIRGWLTGINQDYVAAPSGAHYFGERLSYNYGFSSSQYNGNIAGVTWASANDQRPRAYGYSYDPAGRILQADFTESNSGAWNTGLGRDYTMKMGNGTDPAQAYDANGNIKKMTHFIAPNTIIDELTYNYDHVKTGNKLWRVTDAYNNPQSILGDFKEITSGQAQDYVYDANGNLIVDNNKGINSISYNLLNLPGSFDFTGKGSITYTYDAQGNKLKKVVTDALTGNTVTTKVYINGFEYENGDLKQFAHEEGRVRRKPDGSFVYDYFVKDHLGSVRVTLTEEQVVQEYLVASMEADSAQQEETYYANLAETRVLKPAAYPDNNNNNRYVAKLDGKQHKLGPAILLKVMAGDIVNIQAKSWFVHKVGGGVESSKPLAQQVTSLLAVEGRRGWQHGNALAEVAADVTAMPALISFLTGRSQAEQSVSRPKAYLNWILLDEDLKPIREDTGSIAAKHHEYSGFQQVRAEGEINRHVKEGWQIARSGYVYVFTSNESEDAEVTFEDLGIMTIQGPLLSVNHTYPFGLPIAGISSQATGQLRNQYQFNGKELQRAEFSDGTGLEQYDFQARHYSHQLGRFLLLDPKADAEPGWTPFRAFFNNPAYWTDPTGKLEFKDYNAYLSYAGSNAVAASQMGSQGHWLEADRLNNSAVWGAANLYNLNQENGNLQYTTISQRTAFYGWFQDLTKAKGFDTKWAGAAYIVAQQMSLMEDKLIAAVTPDDVIAFAHAGNKAIFDDVFGNLRKLANGPVLKGNAAREWDVRTLTHEQRDVVEPIYSAQSNETIGFLQGLAEGKGWRSALGYALDRRFPIGGPLSFSGNVKNWQDRFNHGMNKVVPFYQQYGSLFNWNRAGDGRIDTALDPDNPGSHRRAGGME